MKAVALHISPGVAARVLIGDADHLAAVRAQHLLRVLDDRDLLLAGHAPAGKNVDHHDLAAQLRKARSPCGAEQPQLHVGVGRSRGLPAGHPRRQLVARTALCNTKREQRQQGDHDQRYHARNGKSTHPPQSTWTAPTVRRSALDANLSPARAERCCLGPGWCSEGFRYRAGRLNVRDARCDVASVVGRLMGVDVDVKRAGARERAAVEVSSEAPLGLAASVVAAAVPIREVPLVQLNRRSVIDRVSVRVEPAVRRLLEDRRSFERQAAPIAILVAGVMRDRLTTDDKETGVIVCECAASDADG